MKNLCLIIFGLVLNYALSYSQSSLFMGGYGHFGAGPGWFKSSALEDYMRKPEVMGPSMRWNELGINAGGEGFAEIHGFLIGGGAFGLLLPSMRGDSSTAWIGVGAGYFKTGYIFHQTGREMAALNAAFGAGGINVNIKNNSKASPIAFDPEQPIQPRANRNYEIAYALFDFGVSYKVVAARTKNEDNGRYGGLMMGIDAGSWLGVRMDEWRYEGETTGRIDVPSNFFSPYIRLTFGGGSFRRS